MENYLKSDAALRQFVEKLPDYAVVFLDIEGAVVSWNEGARILKGYEADEIVGKHFSEFYTPEARAVGHPERELAVAAALGRYEEEGWRVRKDNSRFWAHVIILSIFDDQKNLCGFGKILRDFTSHKQDAEQSANVMKLLEFTARTDYLTGLDNRRSFDKELSASISNARRHQVPLSLGMIDLDLFKVYNDRFGHQAGDSYLKQATAAWRSTLRPEDFIARYGGEEFIVLLTNTSLNSATVCLERLKAATPGPLTCSIGLAQWQDTETANRLIGRADQALYRAKAQGRNCIETDVPLS